MYAVIMASGQGTRLWPLSRQKKPKQFHALLGKNSLLQDTFERLELKFKAEQIFVSVTTDHLDEAKTQLPQVPLSNFIVEPFAAGTVSCCGMAIETIRRHDSTASVIFVPSDHIITEEKKFIETVNFAEQILVKHPNEVILIGIKPIKADTGMGYIQIDNQIESDGDHKAFAVKGFTEKPDPATAEKYLTTGNYLWNAGIFIMTVENGLNLYKKFLPKTLAIITKIHDAKGTTDEQTTLEDGYKEIEITSIDYAILEKIKQLLVIPGDFSWSDVGSWGTLLEVLQDSSKTEVITRGNHIGVGDEKCMVMAGDKLIATVGLKNIVIVDTDDAILVCNSERSQEIKELLKKMQREGKTEYL